MKKRVAIVVLVFLILSLAVAAADVIQESSCINDDNCLNYGADVYCDLNSFKCTIPSTTSSPNTNNPVIDLYSTDNATVNQSVQLTTGDKVLIDKKLVDSVAALQSKVQQLETKINSLQATKAQVEQFNAELQDLKFQLSQLQSNLQQGFNTVSTGLASLQDNVNSTALELDTFQSQLNTNKTLVGVILFMIIVLGSGAGLIAYFNYSKKKKLHPRVVDYLTKNISAGTKFPQIKNKLMQAGWQEHEVEHAYKETMKNNYQQYKKGKPVLGGDKKKAFVIFGVSIIGLLLVILLIRGISTGQSYYYYGNITDYVQDKPISTTPTCYPPKVLQGERCCLDLNENTICDDTENYVAEGSGASCTMNSECLNDRSCIDGSCKFIFELYDTSNCPTKCNVRRVKITASNEDVGISETYILPRGSGSYTGAGALEWQVLEGPDYCLIKPEEVTIPLKLIEKFDGEILSEEVMALKPGEKSKIIEHPFVDLYGFTLTVNEVYHTCGEAVILG